MSIITYGGDAAQLVSLCELATLQTPRLQADGSPCLGGALRLLTQCMNREIVKATATEKGDFLPLVFMVSFGIPSDDWEVAMGELRASAPMQPRTVGVSMGPQAAPETLLRTADKVVACPKTDESGFAALFEWMTATIEAHATTVSCGPPQAPSVEAQGLIRMQPLDRLPGTGQEPMAPLPKVKCIVIMPFDRNFDDVFKTVCAAGDAAECGVSIECYWLKDILAAGRITDDIVDGLGTAALCIADLTGNNANVMWEAGYAMALGKPTILIGQDIETLPFDLKVHRVLSYHRERLELLEHDLRKAIRQTVERYQIETAGTAGDRQRSSPLAIAVTGSMSASAPKAMRRLESLLSPYLRKGSLWYCGSNGIVDQGVVRFLVSSQEQVVVVGYHALDIAPEIRSFVEKGTVEFLDASVESVPRTVDGMSRRDTLFLNKADLIAVFWNGESKGTESFVRACEKAGKNFLLAFI